MRRLVLVVLAACGGARDAPERPIANAGGAPVAIRAGPLSRDEIARTPAPRDADEARQLVIGAWEGRRYDYDSEHDFAGEPGDGEPYLAWFDAHGRYHASSGGCSSDGRYEITRSEGSEGLELRLFRERSCNGAPPYNWPNYINGLNGGVLVLVDGMTAGVSAFRRKR